MANEIAVHLEPGKPDSQSDANYGRYREDA
jgi:hypothetical protein